MIDNSTPNYIAQGLISISNGTLNLPEAEILTALAIILASVALAKLSDIIFNRIVRKISSKTTTDIDDKIIDIVDRPIFLTVVLLGTAIALSTITYFTTVMHAINNLIYTVLALLWARTLARSATVFIRDFLGSLARKTESSLDDEMLPLLDNLSKIIIYFLGLTMVLVIWEIDITPFLASAGIVGIAIAFAAQNTIAHIFGGISVYFDKPFKVGDRIQLDSGEYGDVIEIGIRSTRILTLDDTLIVIPNDTIANSKIINYHAPYSRMKVKMKIGVAYGSDVEKVKKTLLKIADEIPEVLKDPNPVVLFTEHADFSLNFLLITWVDNPKQKGTVTDQLNTLMDREFKKEGIDIPFPTQTLYTITPKEKR